MATYIGDEYQDTNIAQYPWLRRCQQGIIICAVVDDDQSSMAGAEVGNILKQHRFSNALVGWKKITALQAMGWRGITDCP